jgi:hypothetical protein
MAQLPQPGSDEGVWGNILNDFLRTSHKDDGTLKDNSVSSSAIANNSVTHSKIAAGSNPVSGQTLSYNGTGLAWATPSQSGPVADATTTAKGLVQLAGDLAGTAAAPTVPGLASKANASDVVTIASTQTISGNKNFTGTLQQAGVAVVTTTDARLTNERIPVGGSVTADKIADNTITEPKLAAANTPSTNQVLSWNGTTLAWAAPAVGGVGDPTLGGDLSGTGSNAQIVANAVGETEIADNAVTTDKILNGNVTADKLATNSVTAVKITDNVITEPKLAISNTPAANQVLSWNGTALVWVTPAAAGGSSQMSAVNVSDTYTAENNQFVICDTSTTGFTVTLPAPTNGAFVSVKKKTNNVNAVLVAPPSGVIDAGNATSVTISVNSYGMVADFRADGSTWHQVG